MTAQDAAKMSTNWQLFIPVVALVSILGGWHWAGTSAGQRWTYILRQVVHWVALIMVIRLLYAHAVQDFLNDEQDAFVTIYVIGLAAVLSGIYLDWKMALFGIFLLLSGVGIAWLKDNYLLLMLGMGGVSMVAVGWSLLIRGRSQGPEAGATGSGAMT
jgi:hypothetical protein